MKAGSTLQRARRPRRARRSACSPAPPVRTWAKENIPRRHARRRSRPRPTRSPPSRPATSTRSSTTCPSPPSSSRTTSQGSRRSSSRSRPASSTASRVSKDNPELLKAINEALAKVKESRRVRRRSTRSGSAPSSLHVTEPQHVRAVVLRGSEAPGRDAGGLSPSEDGMHGDARIGQGRLAGAGASARAGAAACSARCWALAAPALALTRTPRSRSRPRPAAQPTRFTFVATTSTPTRRWTRSRSRSPRASTSAKVARDVVTLEGLNAHPRRPPGPSVDGQTLTLVVRPAASPPGSTPARRRCSTS